MIFEEISSFSGKHRFLSNFWPAEIKIFDTVLNREVVWPTAEHAYQAHKTLDAAKREEILNAPTPGRAKRLGQKLSVRSDWEDVRLDVMWTICFLKFHSHPELMEKLKATGDVEIIEGNTWGDTFWGVCDGIGKNNLGKILMEIRDD